MNHFTKSKIILIYSTVLILLYNFIKEDILKESTSNSSFLYIILHCFVSAALGLIGLGVTNLIFEKVSIIIFSTILITTSFSEIPFRDDNIPIYLIHLLLSFGTLPLGLALIIIKNKQGN